MQTEKIRPFPVILFSSRYWEGFLDWLREMVLAHGAISEEDFELLRVIDKPEDVLKAVQKWDQNQEVMGRKALKK